MSPISNREPLSPRPAPGFLLVGPYDPTGGEFTFLAPPLGVWRLAGTLEAAGFEVQVFDPNCAGEAPEKALEKRLRARSWDVLGFSTTGMTLRYDLALAHLARRVLPEALLVAGGMEATFKPRELFRLAPFDLVVLGEGEGPLLEIGRRLRAGSLLHGIPGTAFMRDDGDLARLPRTAMERPALRDAIFRIPYEKMPYRSYWDKLERCYRVGDLPYKAEREARLAEIRSVRLITLNYCPMGCTFCSSTNFLHAAQGGTARIARLEAEECLAMLRRIVAAQPGVRTVIFQDDIFVFRQDQRILPLCEAILAAKRSGDLPDDLQFISTNRVDAMNRERLTAMRRAGFRVLGFGIESFSLEVLKEFNKAQIHPHVREVLATALELGITPFLDIILTSPRSRLDDLAETIRQAFQWMVAGCEVGMYPYVIPFSGAVMAGDPELVPWTVFTRQSIAGTGISWDQPAKILPIDPEARGVIVAIEAAFELQRRSLQRHAAHMPSRLRSFLWILCAMRVLSEAGHSTPGSEEIVDELLAHLPGAPTGAGMKTLRGALLSPREALACP
ncbi:MAG TPA: radical SAM protein [Candidatus Dormibacteraeota bacterium]|nr:radical SAM protein [Candidatus Dormibacteraeota bacterium]